MRLVCLLLAICALCAAPASATPPRLVVVGDSYTGGSNMGGNGPKGWAPIVAKRLGWQLTQDAEGGTGYTRGRPGGKRPYGQRLADLAKKKPKGTRVVIVFGSRNDSDAAVTESKVREALGAFRKRWPQPRLLVVSSPWTDANPPSWITSLDGAVERGSSDLPKTTFRSPIRDRWFFDRPELIGSDKTHPTDAGHRYMAGKMLGYLATLGYRPRR